jgi:DNA-binding CsgD family transcriptional regulator
VRIFADRWSSTNIVRERGLALPNGAIYQFKDIMPRADFERTTMYREWFGPQRLNHMLAANAAKNAGGSAGICFYRDSGRGPFGSDEARLLQALMPHLQRSVALNLRLGRIRMERDNAVAMLNHCDYAAILVDLNARVLFANASAEAMLRDGSGLLMRGGRLASRVAAITEELRALIAGNDDDISGGLLALPRRDGRTLTALVLPLRAETAWVAQRPAAIVFVKDPPSGMLPSRDDIQKLFCLTPAQAAVAREVLHGDGLDAAARRLGIAHSTARTHLLEVFQKTGTSRQAELVRVLLQQTVSVHSPTSAGIELPYNLRPPPPNG